MRRILYLPLALCLLSAPLLAEKSASGLDPLPAESWDAVKAAHLLNRAGFGGTPQEILQLSAMSLEQAVAYLLDYEKLPRLAGPELPEFDPESPQNQRQIERLAQRFVKQQRDTRRKLQLQALQEALDPKLEQQGRKSPQKKNRKRFNRDRMRQKLAKMSPEERMLYIARRRATSRARRAHDRRVLQYLRTWWVQRMVETRRPLEEKMTLFWHGHFATGYQTVRNSQHMLQQNQLFRRHAVGNFADLVLQVAKDPAMLRYLDGNRNVKAKPNENFARELMELFTIGRGNYTEKDIKEAARAFTGWSFNRREGGFVFRRSQHDYGAKRFMGRDGEFDGGDIVKIIMERTETARFICTKLARFFLCDQPDPQLIDELAATFRESGYELKPVLRRLFTSQAFYGARVINGQIKSPVQLMVGAVRALGLNKETARLHTQRTLPRMGQNLFQPPNVKGWDGGRAWINSSTLLIRYNLIRDMLLQDGRGAGKRKGKTNKQKSKKGGKRKKARKNRPAEQRMDQMMDPQQARRRRRGAPISRLAILERFESFETPEEVINHLTLLLLQRELPAARMARLRAVLMPEGTAFDPRSRATQERIVKLIILITSLPEYQLC